MENNTVKMEIKDQDTSTLDNLIKEEVQKPKQKASIHDRRKETKKQGITSTLERRLSDVEVFLYTRNEAEKKARMKDMLIFNILLTKIDSVSIDEDDFKELPLEEILHLAGVFFYHGGSQVIYKVISIHELYKVNNTFQAADGDTYYVFKKLSSDKTYSVKAKTEEEAKSLLHLEIFPPANDTETAKSEGGHPEANNIDKPV